MWADGVVRVVCGVSLDTSCQDVVIALAQATGKCEVKSLLLSGCWDILPLQFICTLPIPHNVVNYEWNISLIVEISFWDC